MLVHVDHLVPEMELESDVGLKAGSFLITRRELPGGRLNEKIIVSIRNFASQLAPQPFTVNIKANELAYTHLKGILEKDIVEIAEKIESAKEYPNFLSDLELRGKVMRVMEKLISNPDVIRSMYDFKVNSTGKSSQVDRLLEHSIRVTLLAIALGLRHRCSIISLMNVGMASILHDLGIMYTEDYPNLRKLDDLLPNELEDFIKEHQDHGARLFGEQKVTMLPHTKNEIMQIIGNHHRPNVNDPAQRNALLLYLAELVDEMITEMPHKMRYNFSSGEIKILGERFSRRTGLMNVLLGLIKLYKGKGVVWEMVCALADIFSMNELLVEGYEEQLKDIIAFCPYKCAAAYPHSGSNSLPRTIYCNNSLNPDFSCKHMAQVKIEIQMGPGSLKSYNKCATLGDLLHNLNKEGREDADLKTKGKHSQAEKSEPKQEKKPESQPEKKTDN